MTSQVGSSESRSPSQSRESDYKSRRRVPSDESDDSHGTEVPEPDDDGVVDEVGAQEAFVAGMIYALSRRIAPGPPYTPFSGDDPSDSTADSDKAKWRLDECLR